MAKKQKEDVQSGGISSIMGMINSFDKDAEIIQDSVYSNIEDWIPSGNYILNACMSGDLFKAIGTGKIFSFCGPSSTGKSFLATSCCREAQKKGYIPIVLDSEGSYTADFVKRLGVNPAMMIIKQVNTILEASQFMTNTLMKLKEQQEKTGAHDKIIFVLDSLGNLSTDKERDDTMKGENKVDFNKAKDTKAMFRVLATPLAQLQVPLIVCNHTYQSISFIPQNIQASGCLIPDEKIITNQGIKKMKDIKEGEMVLSHDNEYHLVEKVWNLQKPTYKFEFENNETIECSNIHKFLVDINHPELEASWKIADELSEGDDIYIINNYKTLKIVKKSELLQNKDVIDLTVADTHTYVSKNGIINHNSGIMYSSSCTIELSAAKLEDKKNDTAAKAKVGAENATKNGVLVTAKPVKSRFCRPIKVKFQIPFFKAPNPYVGLEQFMTWENSGVVRGNLIDQKTYEKLSDAEKKKIHTFEFNGETKYVEPKDTARNIVVKHLGEAVSIMDFFTSKVFTPEFLEELNINVIHPIFDLPDQSAFDDVAEIENMIEVGEQASDTNTPKIPGEEFMSA